MNNFAVIFTVCVHVLSPVYPFAFVFSQNHFNIILPQQFVPLCVLDYNFEHIFLFLISGESPTKLVLPFLIILPVLVKSTNYVILYTFLMLIFYILRTDVWRYAWHQGIGV